MHHSNLDSPDRDGVGPLGRGFCISLSSLGQNRTPRPISHGLHPALQRQMQPSTLCRRRCRVASRGVICANGIVQRREFNEAEIGHGPLNPSNSSLPRSIPSVRSSLHTHQFQSVASCFLPPLAAVHPLRGPNRLPGPSSRSVSSRLRFVMELREYDGRRYEYSAAQSPPTAWEPSSPSIARKPVGATRQTPPLGSPDYGSQSFSRALIFLVRLIRMSIQLTMARPRRWASGSPPSQRPKLDLANSHINSNNNHR